jgi:hypothetical protein
MASTRAHGAPTIQLLEWLTERPRGYAETIEAWKSSCPRLTVWEDALADGLIRVAGSRVDLTPAGARVLDGHRAQKRTSGPV